MFCLVSFVYVLFFLFLTLYFLGLSVYIDLLFVLGSFSLIIYFVSFFEFQFSLGYFFH